MVAVHSVRRPSSRHCFQQLVLLNKTGNELIANDKGRCSVEAKGLGKPHRCSNVFLDLRGFHVALQLFDIQSSFFSNAKDCFGFKLAPHGHKRLMKLRIFSLRS